MDNIEWSPKYKGTTLINTLMIHTNLTCHTHFIIFIYNFLQDYLKDVRDFNVFTTFITDYKLDYCELSQFIKYNKEKLKEKYEVDSFGGLWVNDERKKLLQKVIPQKEYKISPMPIDTFFKYLYKADSRFNKKSIIIEKISKTKFNLYEKIPNENLLQIRKFCTISGLVQKRRMHPYHYKTRDSLRKCIINHCKEVLLLKRQAYLEDHPNPPKEFKVLKTLMFFLCSSKLNLRKDFNTFMHSLRVYAESQKTDIILNTFSQKLDNFYKGYDEDAVRSIHSACWLRVFDLFKELDKKGVIKIPDSPHHSDLNHSYSTNQESANISKNLYLWQHRI